MNYIDTVLNMKVLTRGIWPVKFNPESVNFNWPSPDLPLKVQGWLEHLPGAPALSLGSSLQWFSDMMPTRQDATHNICMFLNFDNTFYVKEPSRFHNINLSPHQTNSSVV